jgi:hypothetical protein
VGVSLVHHCTCWCPHIDGGPLEPGGSAEPHLKEVSWVLHTGFQESACKNVRTSVFLSYRFQLLLHFFGHHFFFIILHCSLQDLRIVPTIVGGGPSDLYRCQTSESQRPACVPTCLEQGYPKCLAVHWTQHTAYTHMQTGSTEGIQEWTLRELSLSCLCWELVHLLVHQNYFLKFKGCREGNSEPFPILLPMKCCAPGPHKKEGLHGSEATVEDPLLWNESLAAGCTTQWHTEASVNDIHVSGQDFPPPTGGRAVVITHYVII